MYGLKADKKKQGARVQLTVRLSNEKKNKLE